MSACIQMLNRNMCRVRPEQDLVLSEQRRDPPRAEHDHTGVGYTRGRSQDCA